MLLTISRGKTPGLGDADAQILERNPQHLQRRSVFGAVLLQQHTPDLGAFFGEVILAQQAAEVVEHRADEDLLDVLAAGTPAADVPGQHTGQIGAQELILELIGIVLVLQVFEKQDRDGNAAHRIETENDDRPRYGADVAATGLPVIRRVDHAQNLVGQRKILEDRVRDSAML
jgi:hypothetical protein